MGVFRRHNSPMRTYARVLPAAIAGMLVVFAPPVAAAPGTAPIQAPFPVALQPDGIQARGAALAEGNTGLIVWSREAHTRVPVASLTKVMTALVVLEAGDLERAVTVPQSAIDASAAHGGVRRGWLRVKCSRRGSCCTR